MAYSRWGKGLNLLDFVFRQVPPIAAHVIANRHKRAIDQASMHCHYRLASHVLDNNSYSNPGSGNQFLASECRGSGHRQEQGEENR